MTEQDFIPKPYTNTLKQGKVTWESPSNIALVKYWGKRDPQIPENPSISFTLSQCKTITTLSYKQKEATSDFSFDVFLDGEKKDAFKPKIETFFKRVEQYVPFLKDFHFTIETKNTFPHSSGIASSASGMSALALCLMSVEKLFNTEMSNKFFNHKASFLARLGSGSACRSVEGDLIVWGYTKHVAESSDLFGVKYPYAVHDHFKNYQDTILLIDKGEKQVSSTVGHNLMHNHPNAASRFQQAHDNLEKLKPILEAGDIKGFISLMESEALTLHAMMMTSNPYYILMKPNTLEVINRIWKFRQDTGLHIGFTLDAGANVHILYPESEKVEILNFIENELVAYCKNGEYICDQIGFGANQIE
ncbi:diphosphomevalonate decarboxylase [Meridianimaribacter sp. CL38]|uniref:diphosphomevalonate/mevalonate 3,5-bisphosphate decarboxylase family protein n=1 Tax=Meridianimaribacter sp. CL38 TaxID=2213021 RepID=UPI0010392B2F|nr:diphosphomevalonate decarboxylase [Meridianimaribacter sp. CL38]TBV27935.1 diphosphomevalonate decarboxylase [Meridianimaribacter sp. CL38]